METIIIKSAIRCTVLITNAKKKNTIGNWRVSLGSGVSVLPALPFSVPRVRPTLYWTWNAIDRASDTSWVIQLEHGVAICMLSCKYIYIYLCIYNYTSLIARFDCAPTIHPGWPEGEVWSGSRRSNPIILKIIFREKMGTCVNVTKRAFKNVFVRTGRKASRPKEKWIAIEAVLRMTV